MNYYEKCFRKGEYDKVVTGLELTKKPDEIWLVVDSYVQMNQIDNAVRTIENNREILLKDDPKKTMFINIDLLVNNKDYVRALITLNFYEELPYISIEVEELLSALKKYIYKSMNKKISKKSDDDIIKDLNTSNNLELLMQSLIEIQQRDINVFLETLKDILKKENYDETIKTFALLLLSEKRVMEEVTYVKGDITYNIVPYELDPLPSAKEIEQKVFRYVSDKDVSVLNSMTSLISNYALKVYPDDIFVDGEEELIMAFYLLAYKMYGKDLKLVEDLIKSKNLNLETIKALAQNIENILQDK